MFMFILLVSLFVYLLISVRERERESSSSGGWANLAEHRTEEDNRELEQVPRSSRRRRVEWLAV